MFAPCSLDTIIDDYGWNYRVDTDTNEGDFDDVGVFTEASENLIDGFGVIIPITRNAIVPVELGVYAEQSRLCLTRDSYELSNIIIDGDLRFSIHEKIDNSCFNQTDLNAYVIKKLGRLDNSNERSEFEGSIGSDF